ncbi:MAG: DEAD/DEAH box helicase, partial [Pseudomonadales bacterium]|nr:DEAD/DEAH box helicase [Pseudomonadales bacterium]
NNWQQVLVFARTKVGSNKLSRYLESEGIKTDAIHGNKSQGARTKALSEFKDGKTQVLVATDIAARGLDIDQLPQVVNFDLPNVAENYVHRIGRTGRAGASGQAISLVSADEITQLNDIERLIIQALPRKLIDGFEPKHDVPASKLDFRPIRPKKPKKPKSQQTEEEHPDKNSKRHKPPLKGKQGSSASQNRKAVSSNAGGKSSKKTGGSVNSKSTRLKQRSRPQPPKS